MKKTLCVGVAMLAVAATAVGWRTWSVPDKPARPASTPNAAAELRQKLEASPEPGRYAAALKHVAQVRASADPNAIWWQRPFSEVYGLLRAAADAGDMQAAYALGSRSARCATVLRERTPEILLADYQRDIESMKIPDDPERTEVRLMNINGQFRRALEAYEDCAAVGEERVSEYLSWLERAGRAGVVPARLGYARHAMEAYRDDRGALIADIEAASERRARAREWLEQLVGDGNEEAFGLYADALTGQGRRDGLYAEDRAKGVPYEYALRLLHSRRRSDYVSMGFRSRRDEQFSQEWAKGVGSYDGFTPQQLQQMSERGRALYREHFEHHPVMPNR